MKKLEELVGARIKEVRERHMLTQAEFAERIAVTPSAINLYEHANRKPSTEILVRIATEFSVSTDFLLGCSETPQIFLKGDARDFLEAYGKLQTRDQTLLMQLVKTMLQLP